jgi:hypothetical protein
MRDCDIDEARAEEIKKELQIINSK